MKPLKETKVGQWLKAHAPQILETAGDFVPAPIKGALGIVKNLVGLVPGITADQVTEFNGLADEYEAKVIELHNEEMANARSREIEMAKTTGKKDQILLYLAIFGVGAPTLILTYLLWAAKSVDPLVAGFIGVIIGSYTQVFNYYFGSSSGSKAKSDTIDAMTK
jgi:hypothetical protein